MCSALYEESVGSLTSHRFITCTRACETRKKTRKSNRLQMLLQRRHFLLSHLKDPGCWSGRRLNLRPPAQQIDPYPIELTERQKSRPRWRYDWSVRLLGRRSFKQSIRNFSPWTYTSVKQTPRVGSCLSYFLYLTVITWTSLLSGKLSGLERVNWFFEFASILKVRNYYKGYDFFLNS